MSEAFNDASPVLTFESVHAFAGGMKAFGKELIATLRQFESGPDTRLPLPPEPRWW